MTTKTAQNFERWIRSEFRELNTELENLYFAEQPRDVVSGIGNEFKQQLYAAGNQHIERLIREGNTDEGFDSGFELLGNVGFFMAACRRHEIGDPLSPNEPAMQKASALAMQLGASLGVTPRFASAHLETHNLAIDGRYKSFTSLDDEALFLEYNIRGVFAFIRASEALRHCLPLGISHPVTFDLLTQARKALDDVAVSNAALFKKLDADRFFYSVRPYYKPHYVGAVEYRGANAGDFAGINVVDLLLGLCRADDPYYSQMLVEKFLYMRPDDQLVLRDCMRRPSLLDQFLDAQQELAGRDWYQRNAEAFLQACAAHGRVASQHHDMLVSKFIEQPSVAAGVTDKADLTASGPPLPVLLKSLQRLRDLRNAADVPDIGSRHQDIKLIKASLEKSA
ncbi:MAG: DUF1864 family protein [Gammaproteobacteria bacterium]|nr:DUF1864 family protein [Gammaproteobacteria bacterium]